MRRHFAFGQFAFRQFAFRQAGPVVAALALLCLAPWRPAQAAPANPQYSRDYRACIGKAQGVDLLLDNCDTAEIGRQDQALKASFAALTAATPSGQLPALQKAQQAWAAFRDSECDYASVEEQGFPLGDKLTRDCYLRMTYDRIQALKRYAHP